MTFPFPGARRAGIAAALLTGAALTACGPGAADRDGANLAGADTVGTDSGVAVRVSTFNTYLNRPTEGGLIASLRGGQDMQAAKVAEIIQRTAPDVILLNEFDYDPDGEALAIFQRDYLEVSQNGAPPTDYPYAYVAPSNTGEPSGLDLNNDGQAVTQPGARAYGDDSFGYGEFPGQYAMALLSKYPIETDAVRTFRMLRWKDMPGAMLPDDPDTPEPADWYDAEELEAVRLSSKTHADIPVRIGGRIVHILASHPTPTGFDGPENRNGMRNHDEIRLWADYVADDPDGYIRDDSGAEGGLSSGACFVVMGDLNADPHDGEGVAAIAQLLDAPQIDQTGFPASEGGAPAAQAQGGANIGQSGPPAEDTADFSDGPGGDAIGNLHIDYVLPSRACFEPEGGGVFWPAPGDPHYDLVGPGYPIESSDHRLVWRDLAVLPKD